MADLLFRTGSRCCLTYAHVPSKYGSVDSAERLSARTNHAGMAFVYTRNRIFPIILTEASFTSTERTG